MEAAYQVISPLDRRKLTEFLVKEGLCIQNIPYALSHKHLRRYRNHDRLSSPYYLLCLPSFHAVTIHDRVGNKSTPIDM